MRRLIYLLPLLLLFAAGCFNNKSSEPTPDPSGKFSGEFRRLDRITGTSKFDTVKATVEVYIEPGVGYHVLGDTSVVHAGSKGHYGISGNGIRFVDSTYPANGNPTKNHLNGDYLFDYNGSVFRMIRSTGDTLSLQYDLKKVN